MKILTFKDNSNFANENHLFSLVLTTKAFIRKQKCLQIVSMYFDHSHPSAFQQGALRLDHCLSPDLSTTAGLGGDNMTAVRLPSWRNIHENPLVGGRLHRYGNIMEYISGTL